MRPSWITRYSQTIWFQSCITALLLGVATLLSMLMFRLDFSETNIVVTYILSVLVVSRFTKGFAYGIVASVVGMLSYNFFFTEPRHTLNVYNKSYLVTFTVMLAASILTSTLTSKILQSSKEAKTRENQSQLLYQITSSLAKATSVTDVSTVTARCLSNLLDCDVACIVDDAGHKMSRKFFAARGERGVTATPLDDDMLETEVKDRFILPVSHAERQYGIIVLPQVYATQEGAQNKLLLSIATQVFTAMERERLVVEKETAKHEAERERFKSSLLRAISHDLRTPLSAITGTAEVLLYSLKDAEHRKLVQGIYDDSHWLKQMMENILSLTKLQEGTLILNKSGEAAEEIVCAAVNHITKYTGRKNISVRLPETILIVPMDGKLIMQVLVNLLDNAVKHTQETDDIRVEVQPGKNSVWFSVSDGGPGIDPSELAKVFDLFFVSEHSHADAKRGNGLGLAICKAIVNAHGGRIVAENNAEGGATIRFSLPLREE